MTRPDNTIPTAELIERLARSHHVNDIVLKRREKDDYDSLTDEERAKYRTKAVKTIGCGRLGIIPHLHRKKA
jgi:hypothetical protein